MELDRTLIGQYLEREAEKRYGSVIEMDRQTKIGRLTVHRLKANRGGVSERLIRAASRELGMDEEALHLLGVHDWDGAVRAGVDPAHLTRLRREAEARVEAEIQAELAGVDEAAMRAATGLPAKRRGEEGHRRTV